MTTDQKKALLALRHERDQHGFELALKVLNGGADSHYSASKYMALTRRIAALLTESHCGDCGAATSEPCSPTCGFDGPTPSDAMADATEMTDGN